MRDKRACDKCFFAADQLDSDGVSVVSALSRALSMQLPPRPGLLFADPSDDRSSVSGFSVASTSTSPNAAASRPAAPSEGLLSGSGTPVPLAPSTVSFSSSAAEAAASAPVSSEAGVDPVDGADSAPAGGDDGAAGVAAAAAGVAAAGGSRRPVGARSRRRTAPPLIVQAAWVLLSMALSHGGLMRVAPAVPPWTPLYLSMFVPLTVLFLAVVARLTLAYTAVPTATSSATATPPSAAKPSTTVACTTAPPGEPAPTPLRRAALAVAAAAGAGAEPPAGRSSAATQHDADDDALFLPGPDMTTLPSLVPTQFVPLPLSSVHRQLVQLVARDLTRMHVMIDTPDLWKPAKNKHGVVVSRSKARTELGVTAYNTVTDIPDAAPLDVWRLLYDAEGQVNWSPTVSDYRSIGRLTTRVDVTSAVAHGAAGGLIAPRVFISVRGFAHHPTVPGGLLMGGPSIPDDVCSSGQLGMELPHTGSHVVASSGPSGVRLCCLCCLC